MKMQIEFYSEKELSINIDFEGRYPVAESETNELFLLACFALRQLKNLGGHLVANLLAGVLISGLSGVNKLIQDVPEISSGANLLMSIEAFSLKVRGMDQAAIDTALVGHRPAYAQNPNIKLFDEEYVKNLPTLVEYKGDGKKSFVVVSPPFRMNMKGFGIIGWNTNYFAFQSVVGLIRVLGRKHIDDETFLKHLEHVIFLCGSAHIFGKISIDQPGQASFILKEVGLM